jgi:hypothetical protein
VERRDGYRLSTGISRLRRRFDPRGRNRRVSGRNAHEANLGVNP